MTFYLSTFALVVPTVITIGYSAIDFPQTRSFPGVEDEPDFEGPINNVTVALGREAILVCTTTELGNYRVGWMKADDQTILSLHTRLVTHNPRIGITYDHNNWGLHIRQVKASDKGCYMCQINTSIMKKQVGCIDVHIPPDIEDVGTSSDVTVQEGENATLTCKAKGHPTPRITWRREDSEQIVIRKTPKETFKVESFSGDSLHLVKLDRKQMGAYFCIASNDVPPAVSKRITLNVNFPPVIKVPNQLLGAPLGTDVQLECSAEAYPNTINYWKKNMDQVILPGPRVQIEEVRNSYKVHMKLSIKAFNQSDVGTYMCVSSNSMGNAEGIVRLYEIKIPTVLPTTTTTEATTFTIPRRETTTTTEMTRVIRTTTQDPLNATPSRTREIYVDHNEHEVSGISSRQHITSGTSLHSQQTCVLLTLWILCLSSR
ncbi:lachesin-like [Macrosteles quadrilineatus]|uniref:lachesin-like n=1 Tax=Macrosteles quadrilineatus TaxID=74068 RepID=UPI0023E2EFFD|nr:lachesin-like [Macrosteles quadrilineatus]